MIYRVYYKDCEDYVELYLHSEMTKDDLSFLNSISFNGEWSIEELSFIQKIKYILTRWKKPYKILRER